MYKIIISTSVHDFTNFTGNRGPIPRTEGTTYEMWFYDKPDEAEISYLWCNLNGLPPSTMCTSWRLTNAL